jgi:hypothetical protein
MRNIQSFCVRHKIIISLVLMGVVVAAIAISGGAPDIWGP